MKIIRNTAAIVIGFFVAPAVAILCAILVFFATYLDFWRGLFKDLDGPITNDPDPNKPKGVWERHIDNLNQKKQNNNSGE